MTGPATLDVDELAEQYSQALQRPVRAARPSLDEFVQGLDGLGLAPHVLQHIATMARLHREGRYDRATTDFESITGHLAQTVREFVAERRDEFN